MVSEYMRQPRSLKQLTHEIRRACDDYWSGKTTEAVLSEYINYAATNTGLMKNNSLSVTVVIEIGKKRTKLLKNLLMIN